MSKKKDIMYIKIRKDVASLCSNEYSDDFRSLMCMCAGGWVQVNTHYLFADSFNAQIIFARDRDASCTHVDAKFVEAVKNDARIGRKRCNYCGNHSIYKDSIGRIYKTCPNCKKSDYIYVFNPDPSTNGVIC